MVPNTAVVKISDGLLHVQDTLSGQMRSEEPDVIIAAVGNQAVETLSDELTKPFTIRMFTSLVMHQLREPFWKLFEKVG